MCNSCNNLCKNGNKEQGLSHIKMLKNGWTIQNTAAVNISKLN